MSDTHSNTGHPPAALHHKDGRPVVLGVDPVEQHPQVQVLVLAELEAVVDELEAERRPVRQGEEVCRAVHLLLLLPGEGGQPGAQPGLHAGRVVAVDEERPGKPAQHVVQRALALPQALLPRAAGLDPVGGQSHGHFAPLPGAVVAVVEMPGSSVGLEDRQTGRGDKDVFVFI